MIFLHHLEQVYGTKPSAETISRLPIKYRSRWRFLDDKSDAKPQAPTACTTREPSTYLSATETGSGRIQSYSAVLSDKTLRPSHRI